MKTWERPQLIILVRSKPEETVLTACKVVGSSETILFPNTFQSACTSQLPGGDCGVCSNYVAS